MKPPSNYSALTTEYYNTHAAEFLERTATVDMSEVYEPFLREIPAGGRILDAGCGSGRDSLAFLQRGFSVLSMDASLEMVKAAAKLTGQEVQLLRFDEMAFESEFDGIWACASLLHIALKDLGSVLSRMEKALKPNGILYASFKHGNQERIEHGRFFSDLDEGGLNGLLAVHPGLAVLKLWTSADVRKDECHRGQRWLNMIVRRLIQPNASGAKRSTV
jgi:SAM-dependent methyltransferase